MLKNKLTEVASFITHSQQNLVSLFLNKKDEKIKAALIEKGFDISDIEFLKANFSMINIDEDSFEHLYFKYGTKDELRIISFEKKPNVEQSFSSQRNTYTQTVIEKYY